MRKKYRLITVVGLLLIIVSSVLVAKNQIPELNANSSSGNGTLNLSNNTDEYLGEKYDSLMANSFSDPDSLLSIIKQKDATIASIQSSLHKLEQKIDSLYSEMDYAKSRYALQNTFSIPDTFSFANKTFHLRNDRVYTKFMDIFNSEVRYAHRYIPKSTRYFPVFDSLLELSKLPYDIRYLAVAESYLNTMAYSRTGAAGVWQFMPATAKNYGLVINQFVDERRDIFKATRAANDYLTRSYASFLNQGIDDWLLAMASYNAGVVGIQQAINEQKGKDFFSLIMKVDETNDYIWRAVAIKMIFENEEKIFGKKFNREPSLYEDVRFADLHLNQTCKLDNWANAQGTVISRIWELNPWIKLYQSRVGKYSKINHMILPAGQYTIVLPREAVIDSTRLAEIEKTFLQRTETIVQYKHHRVKKGETIYALASKFDVSVHQLKQWNNLRRNRLRRGQTLIVGITRTQNITDTIPKLPVVNDTSNVKGTIDSTLQAVDSRCDKVNHKYVVKKGDSIHTISKKLGVKASILTLTNKLKVDKKRNVTLHPGEVLYY